MLNGGGYLRLTPSVPLLVQLVPVGTGGGVPISTGGGTSRFPCIRIIIYILLVIIFMDNWV